ncbi:MAG: hypothetical protein ACR2IV_17545 [Bryobacteraceae bacterium]
MNKLHFLVILAACVLSSVGTAFVLSANKPVQPKVMALNTVSPVIPTPTSTIEPTPTSTPAPTRIPIPTTVQPSANQLYVAAYLMGHAGADDTAGFKSRHGLPDSTSDTELIAFLARLYTTDPARYAQAQATVDQLKSTPQNVQSSPLYVAPPQSVFCTSNTSGSLTTTSCF